MARSRNIKPGFFKNEDLAECSHAARLCFAGLWILADREGRLEDRPKRIKGELFPFDTIDVDPLLQELVRFKFIVRYETDGMKAIQIQEFCRHQHPHYSESPSVIKPPKLPESLAHDEPVTPGGLPESPPHDEGTNPKNSGSTPGVEVSLRGGRNLLIPSSLIPSSLIPSPLPPFSAKTPGEGGSGAAQSAAPPTPPPNFDGTNAKNLNGKAVVPLAKAFDLPDDWGFDAEALGFKPDEVMRESEKFRQYFVAGNGAGKRRTVRGWRQSWSTWLGKAAESKR